MKSFKPHEKSKNIKILDLLVKTWKRRVWCSLFYFFHVICKTSNFNMWTAKHLARAPCTELTSLAWAYIENLQQNYIPCKEGLPWIRMVNCHILMTDSPYQKNWMLKIWLDFLPIIIFFLMWHLKYPVRNTSLEMLT